MISLWKKRTREANRARSRSDILLTLGKRDTVTLGDAFENTLILGSPGSGKTSGSGNAYCNSLVRLGLGGLVLTAKPSDADRWRRICELYGRSDDLIVISDTGDDQFNFMDYQLKLFGGSGKGIDSVVAMLEAATNVASRATGMKPAHGTEQFFENGIRRNCRASAALSVYSTGSVSVSDMLEIMKEMPRVPAQAQNQTWRDNNLINHLLIMARERSKDPLSIHDINQLESYYFSEFPSIAERTRSIFEAGVYGMLDPLSRGALYWIFGRGTNVTPEDCERGKIVVLNTPSSTHGPIGAISQTLFKIAFQKCIQQRTGDSNLPVFLFCDEFQSSITESDYQHAAISRESRCVNVFMTQSIASLYAVLGADESGKAAVDALLGLANYKIFHANADPITNTWAAEAIGRRRMRLRGNTVNHAPYRMMEIFRQESGFSTSTSEAFEFPVMPHVFHSLLRGGPPRMQTEAIVFGSGRIWNGSGETYLKVLFNQG